MPIAAFLWCIGWCLCWVGEKKKKTKPKEASWTENVTVTVALPEDKIEA